MRLKDFLPLSLLMVLVCLGIGFSAQRVVVCEELYQEG